MASISKKLLTADSSLSPMNNKVVSSFGELKRFSVIGALYVTNMLSFYRNHA